MIHFMIVQSTSETGQNCFRPELSLEEFRAFVSLCDDDDNDVDDIDRTNNKPRMLWLELLDTIGQVGGVDAINGVDNFYRRWGSSFALRSLLNNTLHGTEFETTTSALEGLWSALKKKTLRASGTVVATTVPIVLDCVRDEQERKASQWLNAQGGAGSAVAETRKVRKALDAQERIRAQQLGQAQAQAAAQQQPPADERVEPAAGAGDGETGATTDRRPTSRTSSSVVYEVQDVLFACCGCEFHDFFLCDFLFFSFPFQIVLNTNFTIRKHTHTRSRASACRQHRRVFLLCRNWLRARHRRKLN